MIETPTRHLEINTRHAPATLLLNSRIQASLCADVRCVGVEYAPDTVVCTEECITIAGVPISAQLLR